jgi:hypothetical protein
MMGEVTPKTIVICKLMLENLFLFCYGKEDVPEMIWKESAKLMATGILAVQVSKMNVHNRILAMYCWTKWYCKALIISALHGPSTVQKQRYRGDTLLYTLTNGATGRT